MDDVRKSFELVREAQDGDREALDRLIERYYPRVLKVVRLRMGARLRRRLDSGDILQETFSKAVRNFDRFEMRDEGSLINWLAKLTENTISDAIKRETARKRDLAREVRLDGTGAENSAGATVPEPQIECIIALDEMIRAEENELLETCIAQLDQPHREVIILRNYLGLTFAEIARESERPSEGAARMMHAKAMRDLTRLVQASSKKKS